jgi:hypothetical protein
MRPIMSIELVKEKLLRNPPNKGYHPNSTPYKVIVNKSYIKREYSKREKAERYAIELSKKHPKWLITIEFIRIYDR